VNFVAFVPQPSAVSGREAPIAGPEAYELEKPSRTILRVAEA
jgi:hypothetical protein